MMFCHKTEADLPKLDFDINASSSSAQQRGSRPVVKSAVESHRSINESEHDTDSTKHRKAKRNSEGHVLSVKFADDVNVQTTENRKPPVSSSNPAVKVNYEQWARVPSLGKKIPKSTLLRGIQQLRARIKREENNIEVVGLGKRQNTSATNDHHVTVPETEKHYQIKELKRNILLSSERLSGNKTTQFQRERLNSSLENLPPKSTVVSRNPLKTYSQVIDSGVFKHDNDRVTSSLEPEVRHIRNSDRDSAKLRHGMSRIRDRSALPISVYQPISIDDHIFLINEPVKESEPLTSKKIDSKSKKVAKEESGFLFLTDKSRQHSTLDKTTQLHVHLDMILRGNTFTDGFQGQRRTPNANDNFRISRKNSRGLVAPRTLQRTQFVVSNAELYDFSQLSEIRHSMADKLLERSRTEVLFPTQSLRNSYTIYNE